MVNVESWLGHTPELLIPRLKSLIDDLERLAWPKDVSYRVEPTVVIADWAIMRRSVPCLVGRVTGHPSIREGAPAATSELFFLDETLQLARSLSRWYRLDNPMHGGDFS